MQIDCVEWLRHQEIEPDAMIRVLTHVTEFRERERLTDEEVLQLLRRIGGRSPTLLSSCPNNRCMASSMMCISRNPNVLAQIRLSVRAAWRNSGN